MNTENAGIVLAFGMLLITLVVIAILKFVL
jgi:hypothetical protein